MIGSRGYCEVNTMKHDYISMSDDELERLSEMRDAKGRLTDVARRAKHNLWLRYHNEECDRKCNECKDMACFKLFLRAEHDAWCASFERDGR